MDTIQPNTHSFIVKVWREAVEQTDTPGIWRGQITHVPSGKHCAFTDLREIQSFIMPYLAQLGVHLTLWAQVRQRWHNWWRRRPTGQS